MDGVSGILCLDLAVGTGEDAAVIDVSDAVALAVGLEAGVEAQHFFIGIRDLRTPAKVVGRQHPADDRPDAVLPAEVDHAQDVRIGDILHIRVAHVLGNVIDAREQDHRGGADVDHVGPETEKHLGRLLPADAAADEAGGGEEILALGGPAVGDGVTVQDHTGTFRRRQRGVGGGIPVQMDDLLRPGPDAQGQQHQKKSKPFHMFEGVKSIRPVPACP